MHPAFAAAHDATLLPLARDVEFTENGQRLPLGDGLWHTATGRGGYALKLADVERGQAVLMGTIRESGEPTVLVARLAIEARRVTDADMDVRGRATQGAVAEIETLVIRDAQVAARLDEIGTPRRAWSEPVAERQPRADLIRIANAYFSGIERNDGKGDYPLAADCARLENGLVLAGDPALVSPRAKGRPSGPQVGCLEQFRSGIFFYVTRIRDRRFVLVDPERGLIGPVESVLHQVPYGMGSGWSTWEESLSSEPRG